MLVLAFEQIDDAWIFLNRMEYYLTIEIKGWIYGCYGCKCYDKFAMISKKNSTSLAPSCGRSVQWTAFCTAFSPNLALIESG
mmetsp:Transcript_26102/g.77244  ORF Transcript_26102/g.77244 Transcript_26102/m.77244 type:complete len:82 (-) Transcript_26102:223-468(-)